jgi:outer membrane immunogenic protein
VGWTVGGGVEFALTFNWSLKFEYDYINFGTNGVHLLCGGTMAQCGFNGPFFNYDVAQRVQVFMIGVNYRFNMGPTVVAARY